MIFWPLTRYSDFATDQTFHQFHDVDTEFELRRITIGVHEELQRGWHASRERLPFRAPGSVLFVKGGLHMLWLLRPFSQVYTNSMTFIPSLAFECGMPAGSAYPPPPGHLVPSILGFAYAQIVDTSSPYLSLSFLDFHLKYSSVLSRFTFILLPTFMNIKDIYEPRI